MTGQAGEPVRRAARTTNLALRSLLEPAALAALADRGVHTGTFLFTDLALGVGAPLVAAAVWGIRDDGGTRAIPTRPPTPRVAAHVVSQCGVTDNQPSAGGAASGLD